MAQAKGHGTLLQLSISSVFTTIAQRVEIGLPEPEHGDIDKTNLDSTWDESIAGLPKGGEFTVRCHYDPAAATHAQCWSSFGTGTTEAWKLILTDPGAAEITFSAWVKKHKFGKAVTDGLVELELTMKITGAITVTP